MMDAHEQGCAPLTRQDSILAVVDFGLKERGGHHAGFAEFVTATRPGNLSTVHFYANQALDDDVREALKRSGCGVMPIYNGNFYACRRPNVDASAVHEEIEQYRRAYVRVLSDIDGRFGGGSVSILVPTADWGHIIAVRMALADRTTRCRDCTLCVMFHPPGATDASKQAIRGMVGEALEWLHRHGAGLYASDFETGQAYSALLGDGPPLPIHPCYLADWPNLSTSQGQSDTVRVLVYSGDAKFEKGFELLPEILEECLSSLPAHFEFLVQFTSAWGNPDVEPTIGQLRRLAQACPRVQLHTEFWTHQAMVAQLRDMDVSVLTHRAAAYAEQSSGLLWLLAYLGQPSVVLEPSWITREAKRLGHPCILAGDRVSLAVKQAASLAAHHVPANDYRNVIYRPFWPWMAARAPQPKIPDAPDR